MKTTKEIIDSLRMCSGDDFDCTRCAYYEAGTEHLDRLHLDAAAELERLDKMVAELRRKVVDNINDCRSARETHYGQMRDQLDGCLTGLNFVLRWIDEGLKEAQDGDGK